MVKRKAAELVEVPAKKLKGEGPKSWRNFTFKGSLILYHILSQSGQTRRLFSSLHA